MRTFLLLFALIITASLPAQVMRPTQPVTKTVNVNNSNAIKTDTTPGRNKTNPTLNSNNRLTNTRMKPSVLNGMVIRPNLKWFIRYVATDPDVKAAVWATDYHAGEMKYISNKGQTPQWKADFIWYAIPDGAQSARVEISAMPFSAEESPALIQTKMVQRNKKDSIEFTIDFKENPNAPDYTPRGNAEVLPVKRINNYFPYKNFIKELAPVIVPGVYYVRLTPLNANGQPVSKPGNTIKIVPDYISFPIPPAPTSEDSLQSDYEITAVKYTSMHYPEQQYTQCMIITGYNDGYKVGPMGNTWNDQLLNSFKQALPIGTRVCPAPPKQKSWYEEAFDDVTNAAAIAVNGASKLYTETKDYLKNKFSEYMCNYDPVVSTNKKMLEQTGLSKQKIDEGCNTATGVAFELAMTYAGMPPSIPNYDEMCRMARGQLVEILVQTAVEKTGMPCDEFCRKQIEEGLNKMIEESAKKNIQNGGFFNYKPDPAGQYRAPYVEIEITRKRITQKGSALFTKLNFTPIVDKTVSQKDIKGIPYSVNISSANLYENIQLPVPYLKNVGDKIKLVAVLTPKMAYVVTGCSDKRITGIDTRQHLCLGWNTIEQNGDDAKSSSGYSLMLENAVINVNPAGKIKLAPGVNTKFAHHQQ